MQDLGTLGGTWSHAYGINNAGQVVGDSLLSDNVTVHNFLYTGGTMYDLNNLIPSSSGWVLDSVYGINDSGQIVGAGTYNNQAFPQAVLLTPGAVASVTTGTNVTVALGPQVELTFADVVSSGTVTAVISLPGSVPPPVNFSLLGSTSSYDITTSAVFTGNVEVCIAYNPAQITVPAQLLELFHYSGGVWTDITTSVDTVNNVVCGQTSSFSVFAVAEPIYTQEALSIRYAAVQFLNKQDTMGNVQLWANFKPPVPSAQGAIKCTFDEITLFSVPFSEFKRGPLPNLYWYVKNGLDVLIDFNLGQIFVTTPKIALTGLDNATVVPVEITISDVSGLEIGFQNIEMTKTPGNWLVYTAGKT
jgi:probable HAF family extracellular repeat protein